MMTLSLSSSPLIPINPFFKHLTASTYCWYIWDAVTLTFSLFVQVQIIKNRAVQDEENYYFFPVVLPHLQNGTG